MRTLLALTLCLVGTAAAPAPPEEGLEIVLEAPSYEGFDRQGVVEGALTTGLTSLDALNSREGLVGIEAPVVDPRDPSLRPRLVYVFCFGPDADLDRLAALYVDNEHVAAAAPVAVFNTAVARRGWGALKNAAPAAKAKENL